jgi:hypothetical protein
MGLGQRWSLEDVRAHLAQGRPIITLTRYADLPGNGWSDPGTNHYIVQAVSFALNATGAGLMAPMAMRQHLYSASGPNDPGTQGEVLEAGADQDLGIAEQRGLYWKAAILGITSRPVLTSATSDDLAGTDDDARLATNAAAAIDPHLGFPLQVLALIVLGLLALSGPVSLAFLRVPPSARDD